MANKTDKNSYTILFAIVMVVIVGSLLAGFASGLKPRIEANEKFEKQQNILYAMGINNNVGTGDVAFISTDSVSEIFSKFITKQMVIQGDQATEDEEAYLIDIKKESTKANSHHIFKTSSKSVFTHIKLNIFPDGGVARLRLYGNISKEKNDFGNKTINLASLLDGASVIACNNEHFGKAENILAPGKAKNMGDG